MRTTMTRGPFRRIVMRESVGTDVVIEKLECGHVNTVSASESFGAKKRKCYAAQCVNEMKRKQAGLPAVDLKPGMHVRVRRSRSVKDYLRGLEGIVSKVNQLGVTVEFERVRIGDTAVYTVLFDQEHLEVVPDPPAIERLKRLIESCAHGGSFTETVRARTLRTERLIREYLKETDQLG